MNNLFINYTKILILSLILSLPNFVLAKPELNNYFTEANNYLTLDIDFTSDYIYASSNKDKNKKNKFNYINSYNIDSNIFILRSDYFGIKTIQGIRLLSSSVYEDKHNLLYNINLGAELGSQYIGYVGAGYDRLLADKMFINYDNAIDWRYYYKDSSGQSIQDYQFAKVYYKSPRLLNFALHAEFAMHDKNIDNNKVLSNKTKVSVIDNIAGIDIFNMQSLNNSKYFNYRKLSDQESAYVFDAGLNYVIDNDNLSLGINASVIYARSVPDISQYNIKNIKDFLHLGKNDFYGNAKIKDVYDFIKKLGQSNAYIHSKIKDIQDILNLDKTDFYGNFSEEVIKISTGFDLDWDINTFLLDSINISGRYNLVQIASPKFTYGILQAIPSTLPLVSPIPFNDFVFNPYHPNPPDTFSIYQLGWEALTYADPDWINEAEVYINKLNNYNEGVDGAEGFINQFTLQQFFDSEGKKDLLEDLVNKEEAKYYQSSCDEQLKDIIKNNSIKLFEVYAKALIFGASPNGYAMIQQYIADYQEKSRIYINNYNDLIESNNEIANENLKIAEINKDIEEHNHFVSQGNKVDIKKYSKTNHHFVNGSIKLEKFGFFINASANYMFGKHAMYKNNGLFDSAELIKYNVLRTSASVGYEFKDLIVASDSLNLYINSYYNSKEFTDKNSEYIFGMGIRYDL